MKKTISANQKNIYEKIIEEATVDCNDEYDQISGWICLLDDEISTPCKCKIAKQGAVLEKIDSDDKGSCVIGVVRFGKSKLRVLFQDIFLEDSTVNKYIDAYRYWCK